ncbi:hypothetical protein [Cellulomonas sp. NPDC089187]|uniref:hypothetical protein n=1 Tax=Cellulomonas sp. NPDC089187 TaxID=3154970 RepID=UPI003434E6D1
MNDLDRQQLRIYLADHLSGAAAGAARVQRMAESYRDTPLGPDLARLAEDIPAERDWLEDRMHAWGLPPHRLKQLATTVAERVGRLKPNGRVVRPAPMTAVLELDLMRAAVTGKRGLWETLRLYAEELGLDPARPAELIVQADQQIATLTALGERARQQAFRRSQGAA